MSGNRASTPLSSVEGSECDPSDLQHHEHDIALQTISALRATLGDQQPDERQRSPEAPTTAFDLIDDDEDSPHANAGQTPHSTTRVGDESADIDSKTLQAIWSTSANDGTPVESVGDAAIEIVAQSFEKRDPDTPPYVVAVQALDPRTTTRSLFETFFPMGCARAVVYSRDEDVTGIMHTAAIAIMNAEGKDLENPLPVPYPVAGFTRRRIAGLVFFKSEDTARFAAFKMHDFVPHGQSNPLHATFLSGPQFATSYRSYLCDIDVCAVRAAASQPPSSLSAPSSANASAADVSSSTNKRLGSLVQSLFYTAEPPLILMSRNAAKLALKIADLESAASRVTSEQVDSVARELTGVISTGLESDAREVVALLKAAATAAHRNVLRLLDSVLHRCAGICRSWEVPGTAETVTSVVQVPLCRHFLRMMLYASDKNERLGAAAVVASLLDHGLIDDQPFAVCIKLFNSKVTGQQPSNHREVHAESIACLAACIKTAQRNRLLPGHAGADLLGGGLAFPSPRDGKSDGLERDFVAMLGRYREEVAVEAPRTPTHQSANGFVSPSLSPVAGTTPDASRSVCRSPDVHDTSDSSNGDNTPRYPVSSAHLAPPSSRSVVAAAGGVVGLPQPRFAEQGPLQPPSTLNADILPCTVYITRIPKLMSDARLRTILTNFGELNKVRVYDSCTKRGSSAEKDDSSFSFVEFRSPAAARSLIAALDRAAVHLIGRTWENATWHIVQSGSSALFDESESPLLSSTLRCSPARSAIHDHDPRDAVFDSRTRVRECIFGNSPRAGPATPGASTNGPAGFTTRPLPNRPMPPAVPAASVVASFNNSSTAGLNAGAVPWNAPRDLSADLEQPAASSADSSASGFVVTVEH